MACARPSCANHSPQADGLCADCLGAEWSGAYNAVFDREQQLDEIFPERVEERYAPKPVNLHPVIGPDARGTRYGIAALVAILGRLAERGDRNNALFHAAAQAGELVAGGQLDGEYAHRTLTEVALQIAPDERAKSRNTILRGMRRGFQHPRIPQG
jgi:hypothetical protein